MCRPYAGIVSYSLWPLFAWPHEALNEYDWTSFFEAGTYHNLIQDRILCLAGYLMDLSDIDPLGMKRLLEMGQGPSDGLMVLGITAANSAEALPRLCRTVELLSRRVGLAVTCNVPQIIVACCESHWRGGLVRCFEKIGRRIGL